ncbi:MAG: hemolysin family protein [Candidatus Thiodiazotropha lotti]|uniref:Magnesium/cobalt efflux protein n=1 Tax=Candidatus Thiodiazotropha endoloripes TaxID=1818881 RepID=A0A1E2UN61_9GAMM|nr:hemolysin family protein [Candidatus Thiodiazotropha endoloripes]MBW9261254.1 hemolysin family protein [Candidatus Thiodiazotropha sp. (ex. Lucinisca nassula)]MCG7991318.1 hemolysin family protein [Candidatus Thiodiazotropha lotti]MCW4182973.1 hemolysin family protein [Candidatus Thiodiazotropha weberae]MCG7998344.1 hemolysin family protein [Candidatus Thiodiazotropha lotti]MCW4190110.1 hemolysin family protein [Candidatus Thiodiazotropha weberae]
MSWSVELLIIVIFLLLKGFFSGSEIAMVNSDKLKLRHLAKLGNRGAALVLKLFKTPDVILGTTLVGTNLATVIISTLGALVCIEHFGAAGDLISVIILTPILLIFGEVVPKSVFQQEADSLVGRLIYVLRFFSYVFYPVIFIFSRIARLVTRIVGGGSVPQNMFITREELRVLLDISDTTSDPQTIDRKRIRRIIRFADTTVGEAMIPLPDVVGFNEVRHMKEAVRLVMKHGYNRLPVYRGNITNVKGILTLDTWDLMQPDLDSRPISDFISPVLYLSPRQTIDRALPMLQAREDHMAVVVDEFGSAVGILTMEDVFEEVVGEIDVGYDFDEYHPKRRIYIEHENENSHLVSGRTPISEINDILHVQFPVEEALTIGGLMISRIRHIPVEGDSIEEQGHRLTVVEADERSVVKVRIERLS